MGRRIGALFANDESIPNPGDTAKAILPSWKAVYKKGLSAQRKMLALELKNEAEGLTSKAKRRRPEVASRDCRLIHVHIRA